MDLALKAVVTNELGEGLRLARGDRSIESLADELDVSRNTLGDYERGVRAPEIDFLVRFAVATKADLGRLLGMRLGSRSREENILTALTFTAQHNPDLWRRATEAAGLAAHIPLEMRESGPSDPSQRFSQFELIERKGILGSAGAGAENVVLEPKGALAFRLDWLRAKGVTARELIVAEIMGDSMEPTFFHTDTVVFKDQHEMTVDGIYLFVLDDRLFVKRLSYNPTGIEVISDNREKYPPFQLSEKEALAQRFQVRGRFFWRGGDRLQ